MDIMNAGIETDRDRRTETEKGSPITTLDWTEKEPNNKLTKRETNLEDNNMCWMDGWTRRRGCLLVAQTRPGRHESIENMGQQTTTKMTTESCKEKA